MLKYEVMSRTVGPKGPKHVDKDLYETPDWCALALFLREWPNPLCSFEGTLLEPSAGSGHLLRSFLSYFDGVSGPRNHCSRITAVEIDAQHGRLLRQCLNCSDEVYCLDYLKMPPPPVPYDYCIMNPPYGHRRDLAVQFVKKACQEAKNVWALLRLNWVRPAKTRKWLLDHMPRKIYVLPRRPSFTNDGHTDACEYAWMLFNPGRNTQSQLEIIGAPHHE